MSVGVGRVEQKPLDDPKEKERSGSLWIQKGRSVRVGRVDRKRPDQLFISGRVDASIFWLMNILQ
jgi:hypothetical protein